MFRTDVSVLEHRVVMTTGEESVSFGGVSVDQVSKVKVAERILLNSTVKFHSGCDWSVFHSTSPGD